MISFNDTTIGGRRRVHYGSIPEDVTEGSAGTRDNHRFDQFLQNDAELMNEIACTFRCFRFCIVRRAGGTRPQQLPSSIQYSVSSTPNSESQV